MSGALPSLWKLALEVTQTYTHPTVTLVPLIWVLFQLHINQPRQNLLQVCLFTSESLSLWLKHGVLFRLISFEILFLISHLKLYDTHVPRLTVLWKCYAAFWGALCVCLLAVPHYQWCFARAICSLFASCCFKLSQLTPGVFVKCLSWLRFLSFPSNFPNWAIQGMPVPRTVLHRSTYLVPCRLGSEGK